MKRLQRAGVGEHEGGGGEDGEDGLVQSLVGEKAIGFGLGGGITREGLAVDSTARGIKQDGKAGRGKLQVVTSYLAGVGLESAKGGDDEVRAEEFEGLSHRQADAHAGEAARTDGEGEVSERLASYIQHFFKVGVEPIGGAGGGVDNFSHGGAFSRVEAEGEAGRGGFKDQVHGGPYISFSAYFRRIFWCQEVEWRRA